MKNQRRAAFFDRLTGSLLALGFLLGLVTSGVEGCKTGGIAAVGAKVVDCAEKAVREKGFVYIGKVNDILGNTGVSDEAARARLIDLGIDAGTDVIGCLLADQGKKFAEAANANPTDEVAQTASKRADMRLRELQAEGWRFER